MSEFKNKKQLRSHKVVVALNDDEKIFIDNYCNKNNIKSEKLRLISNSLFSFLS